MWEMTPQAVAAFASSVLLPIVSWLVLRAIHGVDSKLDRIDAKVELLAKRAGEHDVRLAELGTRVAMLEASGERLEQRYEDLAGFLHSEGFRRRDGRQG